MFILSTERILIKIVLLGKKRKMSGTKWYLGLFVNTIEVKQKIRKMHKLKYLLYYRITWYNIYSTYKT